MGLIASGLCYGSGFTLLLSNCSSQARGTIHLPLREPHKGSAFEHRRTLLANKHWDLSAASLQPSLHHPPTPTPSTPTTQIFRHLKREKPPVAKIGFCNWRKTMSCHQMTPCCISTIITLKGKLVCHKRGEWRGRHGAVVHKQLCLITGGCSQHLSLPEASERWRLANGGRGGRRDGVLCFTRCL